MFVHFKPPLLSLFHTHRVFYKYICYAFSCQKKLNKFIIVFFLKTKLVFCTAKMEGGGVFGKGVKRKKIPIIILIYLIHCSSNSFFFQNIKVFVIEEGETRTLSSKCSETGRTSKFFFNVLANEEITTLSTFNKEKAKVLKNNSWFRIVRVRCHPVFGLEIKADAVVSAYPYNAFVYMY